MRKTERQKERKRERKHGKVKYGSTSRAGEAGGGSF